MKPFDLHGKKSTDSGLVPWQMGSLARAIFFYVQTNDSKASFTFQGIASYYSLFHLTMYLILGCPNLLSEKIRELINKGLEDGSGDPSPKINHTMAKEFLKKCVGLNPSVLSTFDDLKKIREFINYGPRVLWRTESEIFVNTCEINPSDLKLITAKLSSVFKDAIEWSVKNGTDYGMWTPHILDQLDLFFKPNGFYSKWITPELMEAAGNFRQELLTIAEKSINWPICPPVDSDKPITQ